MSAGAGEHVEGVLYLLDLGVGESIALLVQKGGTQVLPVGAVRVDLVLPREPDGARHHELLVGGAALLLDVRLAVDLLDREPYREDLRILRRHLAYRGDLEPIVGSRRYVRLPSNVAVDKRTKNERRRRNGQYGPDDRPEDPETQEVPPGHGIFL